MKNCNKLQPKTGILLVNLGTPDSLDYFALRRYLGEFLSDPRVVEKPRWFWLPLLQLVLLQIIPQKSAKKYAKIWNYECNESPLRSITRETAQKLQTKLNDSYCMQMKKESGEGGKNSDGDANVYNKTHTKPIVEWAFRYGQPSIEQGLLELRAKGCDKIKLLPLYPQYSSATVGSVCDKVFDWLKNLRYMPALQVVEPYFSHPAYINSIVSSVEKAMYTLSGSGGQVGALGGGEASQGEALQKLVISFHGLPQKCVDKGDPYAEQCHETARLVGEKLAKGKTGLSAEDIVVTFQSRFGRGDWLQPATDEILRNLPSQGITNIAIITPGFAADCIETLEEITISGKAIFIAAGGDNYVFIPCLNASDRAIEVYKELVWDI